jgi:hypothetical protein
MLKPGDHGDGAKSLLADAADQLDNKDPAYQDHTATGMVFILLYVRKDLTEKEFAGALFNFKRHDR